MTLKELSKEFELPFWKLRQILGIPVYKGKINFQGKTIYVKSWAIISEEIWRKAQRVDALGKGGPASWGLKWENGQLVKDENAKKMKVAFKMRAYKKKSIQEIADILELLKCELMTANGLCKALRKDKACIRKSPLVMERQGLVTCNPEKRGKVTYKFWILQKA